MKKPNTLTIYADTIQEAKELIDEITEEQEP